MILKFLSVSIIIIFIMMTEAEYTIPTPGSENIFPPGKLSNIRTTEKINQIELHEDLFQNDPLSTLAINNRYTVVEVWIDGDEKCRQIENQFDSFLDKRADVQIQRVHFELNSARDHVAQSQIKYLPHIEIYGPDRELIAADNLEKRDGTNYLRKWMKYERRQERLRK